MTATAKPSSRRLSMRWADDLRHGRMLSLDFFKRNWLTVLAAVAMLMIYITNRYTCQTQMEQIKALQRELEVAKTERVRAKSAYMSNMRESQMQTRVDSLHLGVSVPANPPYHLQRNSKK